MGVKVRNGDANAGWPFMIILESPESSSRLSYTLKVCASANFAKRPVRTTPFCALTLSAGWTRNAAVVDGDGETATEDTMLFPVGVQVVATSVEGVPYVVV